MATKEETAYHEAGHVLMHLLTEIEINEVNIIDDSEQNGIVKPAFYGLVCSYDTELREDQTRCLLAGGIAEAYYCYRNCLKYDPDGEHSDNMNIDRLFYECNHRYRSYEGFERRTNQLKKETEKYIKSYWPFVITVAENLLSKQQLTSDEIIELWNQYESKKQQNSQSKNSISYL